MLSVSGNSLLFIQLSIDCFLNLFIAVKQTNYNLKYELEPSLEVAVGRSVGTQIALVSGGPLNEKQRFLFQTAVSFNQRSFSRMV